MNAKVIIIKTLASRKLQSKSYEKLAEALLALKYDCPECNGRGKSTLHYTDIDMDDTLVCDTCKGTGKGGNVLAVLDEIQDLPNEIYEISPSKEATNNLIRKLLSQGWKKTIKE
jgi:hypothetical protein